MASRLLSFARDREHIYHRKELAEALVDRLVDPAYKSGLFLSSPRRTGKTTFIRADLLPVLRDAGAVVVYADLWEQRSANPAAVVIAAIQDAILQESGMAKEAVAMSGVKKVKIGGIEIDLDSIGKHDGSSLARTLGRLGAAADKPIVMVLDEAQHAQTTAEGRDTLFGLKAARDAMILNEGKGFRLIATGSSSDRLRMLVSTKDQAFFGAMEEHLPELDDGYLEWALKNSPFNGTLSLPVLREGFAAFSRRPEHLQSLLLTLAKERDFDATRIDGLFLDRVVSSLESNRQAFLASVRAMEKLDVAVLRRMAELGNKFSPFDEAAIDAYCETMGSSKRPTKPMVQNALERLRKDLLIWNAGRGIWFIEDAQHTTWLRSESVSGAAT